MKARVNNRESLDIALRGDAMAKNGVKTNIRWEFLSNQMVRIHHEAANGSLAFTDAELLHHDRAAKVLTLRVNGQSYVVELRNELDELLEQMGMGPGAGTVQSKIKAPMPGLVLEVFVSEGQDVAKDEPLLILEAMKMENVIKAPQEGKVKRVSVEKGKAIDKNALLVEFETE